MRVPLIATVLALCASGQQPDPLLWGSLEPGPHAIGYRSTFELDTKRYFGRPRGPRPVLVNVWYPAEAAASERLRYRGYLSSPPLPRYPLFGPKLERFLFDTLSEDLFRKKRSDLNPDERDFFEALLSKSTLAHQGAAPSKGPFPVLLYHASAAGSYEDNSVICEYLASHGYVVMTSAFPSPDGQHLSNNYGGPETSWSDLAFLLAHAQTLGFADSLNAGAFGHSMGAQYLFEWLGQRPQRLRALVSLDSTLEYTPREFPGHRSLRKRLARLDPPGVPVLIAASADRGPNFATWDRYMPRRAEIAIPYFNHNDFLLHGSLARAFSREQGMEVRRNYDRLARTVRAFFDAHLRGTPADWQRLLVESGEEFKITERLAVPRKPRR
jgi:pimeloyl-ACP methyl ester carboxylesterase